MKVLKSKVLHGFIVSFMAFIPLALLFHPASLYVFLGSILFTTSIAVVIAYWDAFQLAIYKSIDIYRPVDYLTSAIILIFFFTGCREAYVTFYREFFPQGLGRSDDYYLPLAFVRYGAIMAGYAALAARSYIPTHSTFRQMVGWPRAILSLVLGSAIGFFLVWMHP